MIKKLKRRIIIITMSLVGSLLLVAFILFNIFMYNQQASELERSLSHATNVFNRDRFPESFDELDKSPPPSQGGNEPPNFESSEQMPRVFPLSVLLDEKGQIKEIFDNRTNIGRQVIEDAINQTLSKDAKGIINQYSLMYERKSVSDGTLVAFCSIEPLIESAKHTALISFATYLAIMVIMLFVSERLAQISVKPVSEAWEKQRQFVADASHDLKTPLTIILANNDILNSNTGSTILEQKRWIDSTSNEAKRMKHLVEQMLDLAKSEELLPMRSEENISEIVSSAILQLEAVAFEKSITLISSIENGLIAETCPDSYLRIVNILVDNAIKYSKEIKIWIELSFVNKKAVLSVRNIGEVIPKDMQGQIFEKFYRLDETRSTEGHGLGLAIARNLSRALGGTLSVSSDKANGTIFTFSIKAKKS